MSVQRTRVRFLAGPIALIALAAACGSDSGGIDASSAWARTTPAQAQAGAAYLVLSSDEAASIVSASVPADVAGRAELHETVTVDMDAMEDGDGEMEDMEDGDGDGDGAMEDGEMEDMAGAMTMQPVGSIDVPAGGEVVLEPGGIHVMMLDLVDPLEQGETFELTLTTDSGEEINVTVEVRDDAP